MKVLFTFGGMPHYLTSLLQIVQQAEGVDITVIIPDSGYSSIGHGVKMTDEEQDFKLIRLPEYNSFLKKQFFKGFLKILKAEKPDLIVIGWPYILPLSLKFRLLFYIKRNKIGLIFREIPFGVAPYNKAFSYYKENPVVNEDLMDITPKGLLFYIWAISLKFIRKWYYSLVDASLAYAVSAYEIHKSYGLKEEQVFVSCNSPDTNKLLREKEKFSGQAVQDYNPYRLVHIGRLVKWKRVDLLLEAFEMLSKEFPKAELTIIGSGPEEQALKLKVYNSGISDKVNFAGSIYNEDIANYLVSSGIYVLAGMGGLSINEAMAFGKPVICSVCDGTEKSLVRENFNGLYFEKVDAGSLYEKIKYLYNNQHLISEMGRNSELIIRNEINLKSVSDVFLSCFQYVYNKKKKL